MLAWHDEMLNFFFTKNNNNGNRWRVRPFQPIENNDIFYTLMDQRGLRECSSYCSTNIYHYVVCEVENNTK